MGFLQRSVPPVLVLVLVRGLGGLGGLSVLVSGWLDLHKD